MSDELRLYAIANLDALKRAGGNRGKMMAQAGHAFLHAYWNAQERNGGIIRCIGYRDSGAAAKIVLFAEDEAELRRYHDELDANTMGVGVTLVTDAARTVFNEPTVTFLGVGPIRPSEAPEWLKSLRPLI